MSESSMWGTVRQALRGLDPVRIENKLEKGVPDVNYVEGWVELKWVRKAPKNPETILMIDHYTTEQRTWAIRRHHAKGKIFLLLKVGVWWMVLSGACAAEHLNKVTLEELRKVAIKTWYKKLNHAELRQILTSS
jgi:hypothetical protein